MRDTNVLQFENVNRFSDFNLDNSVSVLPSSFTKSVSLLSTSNLNDSSKTNRNEFGKNRFSYNLDLLDMHRSYGTVFDHFEIDRINMCRYGKSSNFQVTNYCSNRFICCCKHAVTNNLLHSRLHRRLYSLIDHSSVSFHYFCARHAITYPTLLKSSLTGNFPSRYSTLKHCHSVTPMFEHELGSNLYSNLSKTELVDTGFDREKTVKSSKLSLDSSNVERSSPVHVPCLMYTSAHSGVNNPSRQYLYKCTGTTYLMDNSNGTSQRCRRNSDPEQWQQIRSSQSGKFSGANWPLFTKEDNVSPYLDAFEGDRIYQNENLDAGSEFLNESKPKCVRLFFVN